MISSNTPSTVENAAKVINTKNKLPHSLPKGILLKTLGRVTKIKFGPASTCVLNAKHAGKIISPDVNATKVSNAATLTASPRRARSFPI